MGAVARLGIPGLQFVDGPRGGVVGRSTAFPVSMARGATWDVDLEERVGRAIGAELRAQGGNFFGGVCINLPRHPAWGRVQETYGEDPVLLGGMGAALVRGTTPHAMACVKHYALNSMENARFSVDVNIDEATLHEYFLPHFRQAVDAGAAAVMSAYNSVDGEWAGQNPMLLTTVLRDDWGFTGTVITDFIWGMRDGTVAHPPDEVGDHGPGEAPVVAQHCRQEHRVLPRPLSVDRVVGAHHRGRTGVDRLAEVRQEVLVERRLVDVHVHAEPGVLHAVEGVVLDAGHRVRRRAPHQRGAHPAKQHRVLTVRLLHASPRGVPRQVEAHATEEVPALGAQLGADRPPDALLQVHVPGRTTGHRDRE